VWNTDGVASDKVLKFSELLTNKDFFFSPLDIPKVVLPIFFVQINRDYIPSFGIFCLTFVWLHS
jgi:hypothetical protein